MSPTQTTALSIKFRNRQGASPSFLFDGFLGTDYNFVDWIPRILSNNIEAETLTFILLKGTNGTEDYICIGIEHKKYFLEYFSFFISINEISCLSTCNGPAIDNSNVVSVKQILISYFRKYPSKIVLICFEISGWNLSTKLRPPLLINLTSEMMMKDPL